MGSTFDPLLNQLRTTDTGAVTAPIPFSGDNLLIRSDGTGRFVQDSQITIDDNGGMMTTGGIGVGISTPTSGINSEGNVDLTNSSASNAVGRVINFRTSTVIRASIAGFRDSAGSGGNIRFNVSAAGGAPVEAMRILSNKFVGINTSTSNAQLQVVGDVNWNTAGNVPATSYITVLQASSTAVQVGMQVLGTGAADSSQINGRFTANGNGPANIMYKSRGGSIGSMTTVVNNDIIGNYTFVGADGTTNGVEVARIRARVDGATGTGNVPGALEFFTNPGSTDQATIGMSLHYDNSLAIGYGTTQQSTMLAVNGTGFFNGNVAASTPTLAPHLTTKAYVDSADALKADDYSVVHLAGSETITGAKTFSLSPTQSIGEVFSPTATPAYQSGLLYFNAADDALTFMSADANVQLNIGQEQYVRVMNSTGSTIANGVPVYINGQSGGLPTIALSGNTTSVLSQTLGLTTESIATGGSGYVTIQGKVRDLNTAAFTAGATVYVGATAGTLTSTIPANPAFISKVGTVLVSNATTGIILVNPEPSAQFTAQSATTDLGVVLSNAGLRAAGTAYPITTSGNVGLTGSLRLGTSTDTAATVTLTTSSSQYRFANAASNAIAYTLPATTTAGYTFTIKKIDATVNPITFPGVTIDGNAAFTLTTQYKYATVVSTTTSGTYYVIANN